MQNTEALSYINNKEILLLTLHFNSAPTMGDKLNSTKYSYSDKVSYSVKCDITKYEFIFMTVQ